MPLVELVPMSATSANTLTRTKEFLLSLGQVPIVVMKEVRGFIQPRLQYALLAEALRLVEDGAISPQDIDKTMIYGLAGTSWVK